MLWSPGNVLDSLFREVRVFKVKSVSVNVIENLINLRTYVPKCEIILAAPTQDSCDLAQISVIWLIQHKVAIETP